MDSRLPDEVQRATFPQFTNLELNEGLVDQLMTTVNFHLEEQYNKGRIHGSDYANTMVGSITAVLQFATQYLLGTMLIDEQKAKEVAQTELLLKQQEEIDGQLALIALEREKLKYQIEELLPLEKQKLELENIKIQQEGDLIAAQILKIDAEILYLDAQKDMMLKQAEKIDKEIEFISAKILTEQANTQPGIADTNSLLGRQMSLLAAQKLGFKGDMQIKAAKVFADYDAVVESVNENGVADLSSQPTELLLGAKSTAESIGGV